MNSDTGVEKTADVNWHQSVWKVVSEIPSGHVLTYGEVARLSGMPRAARRVSQAMRRAPRAINLPWHRVINSKGMISMRASGERDILQQVLLETEGVIFNENGKVDLAEVGWKGL